MSMNEELCGPAIDRDELIERMMGSVEMAERMLTKFMSASEDDCDAMESAARCGDCQELVSLAHRHKGTAQTMAAARVAGIAAQLEVRAKTEQTSELLDLIDSLRVAHAEVREAIQGGLTGIAE